MDGFLVVWHFCTHGMLKEIKTEWKEEREREVDAWMDR